jgi:hypothetical protein
MNSKSRNAALAGVLAIFLCIGNPSAASAGTTGPSNTGSDVHAASGPALKVTRDWKLGNLGSGEAVLGCPAGYGVQFNAIGGPNFGSSNKAISVTPVGYTDTAVTFWLTNWNPFSSESTTFYI